MKIARPMSEIYKTFWNEPIDEDIMGTLDKEWDNLSAEEKEWWESKERFLECSSTTQWIFSIQLMNDYFEEETGVHEPQDGIMIMYEEYDAKGEPVLPYTIETAKTEEELDKCIEETESHLLDADFVEELGLKMIEAAKKVKEHMNKHEDVSELGRS